jgi:hypothetical protein
MSWQLCGPFAPFSDIFRSPIKPSDPATLVEVRAQDDGPLQDLLELRLTASPVSSPEEQPLSVAIGGISVSLQTASVGEIVGRGRKRRSTHRHPKSLISGSGGVHLHRAHPTRFFVGASDTRLAVPKPRPWAAAYCLNPLRCPISSARGCSHPTLHPTPFSPAKKAISPSKSGSRRSASGMGLHRVRPCSS